MGEVKHINVVGDGISQLQNLYNEGKVEGLIIIFKCPDGTFDMFAENLTYIEKLGLLQAGISTVNEIALMEEEEE